MSVFDRFCKIIGYNKFQIWENKYLMGRRPKRLKGILHRSVFVKALPLRGRVSIKKPRAVKCSLPHM
jgi:hypothetical protein